MPSQHSKDRETEIGKAGTKLTKAPHQPHRRVLMLPKALTSNLFLSETASNQGEKKEIKEVQCQLLFKMLPCVYACCTSLFFFVYS